MRKGKLAAVIMGIIWLLFVGIMYYLLLPAFNLHSVGLWIFIILIVLLPALVLLGLHRIAYHNKENQTEKGGLLSVISLFTIGWIAVFIVILISGSKMFHAKEYASILKIKDYDFTQDMNPASAVSKIALMDTNSAILLGNREVGSLSEVVSQYNISEKYTQIDLNGAPLKVSALNYAGLFKYFGNKKEGVPGYVSVDPVSQDAKYVKLDKGMNYVPSAYFSRDLKRHLRTKYPTKIFGNIHFEIDEKGKPYYIASVYEYTIGLFGGETISGAIVCDPVDGSCEYYESGQIPKWVDNVFEGDLLVAQYNWYGKLSNGFWNSMFGKKGCKKCTETIVRKQSDEEDSDDENDDEYLSDYGYVAKDGDIWIYTGVTSVNDDASNIGFILVNERTSEAHYYNIAGADEDSAMSAAEGEVQEKGYKASFPSLINVDGQPTYVLVLKDASGIVKLYAMVNVQSYNIVTTASSLDDCFKKYRAMIGTGSEENEVEKKKENTEAKYKDSEKVNVEFTVASIQYADIEGNTYVYLTASDGKIYKQKFADNEKLIFIKSGDIIKAQCVQGSNGISTILQIQE